MGHQDWTRAHDRDRMRQATTSDLDADLRYEPMTRAQRAELIRLCRETDTDLDREGLSKVEASELIDYLKRTTGGE